MRLVHVEGAVLSDGAPREALDAAASALRACVGHVRMEESAHGDLLALREILVSAQAPAVLVVRAEAPPPDPIQLLALLALVPEKEGSDAVVLQEPEGPDLCPAVYRSRILPAVERCLRDQRSLSHLLDELDTLFVDAGTLHGG